MNNNSHNMENKQTNIQEYQSSLNEEIINLSYEPKSPEYYETLLKQISNTQIKNVNQPTNLFFTKCTE
jgi:hypothetical protein